MGGRSGGWGAAVSGARIAEDAVRGDWISRLRSGRFPRRRAQPHPNPRPFPFQAVFLFRIRRGAWSGFDALFGGGGAVAEAVLVVAGVRVGFDLEVTGQPFAEDIGSECLFEFA